ncbi:type VI secretion system protein TssA [Uliginosibacterium sp. H3]|uniref:Type VI secretion system protein TssA n=1 Tax=Uliginosibacterium silvisoli TaxID=3114758 RepID=A0ABU6K6F0_9RHOO|nr:type VI secretion system protein TssA [Uliginosibacterium sp. H3]
MTINSAADISLLLKPVSEAEPAGSDMSFSSEFDAIQEARRADDASLDQGEWVTTLKEADWPDALQRTTALLSRQTKDLRLASWYTEASAKTHGVSGMARGFALIAGLLDEFWDTLHPLADDGDMEQRIGNLSWLITRSVQLTPELPLVRSGAQRYGTQDLDIARAHQLQLERSPDSEATPRVTLQQFKAAQRATPRSFYEQLLLDCAAASEAANKLAEATDRRLGLDGPSFTPLKSALENYTDTVQRIARESGVIESSATTPPAEAQIDDISDGATTMDERNAGTGSTGGTTGGPIRSRAQALQQLRQVADFFRRTEPHSPVAYLADKAANWGEMPLHVWLKTVLKDEGSIARFEDLLGFEDTSDSA